MNITQRTIPDEEIIPIVTTFMKQTFYQGNEKFISHAGKQVTGKREKAETKRKWKEYKERNNSFIDHNFTGLYRSTVTCERC